MSLPFRIYVAGTLSAIALSSPGVADAQTQLGIAHIGGAYSLTDTDYLNEGAEACRLLGARCIKVSLSLDDENPSPKLYPFHANWPKVTSLVELAKTSYYVDLFSKDFDTFILTSFRPARPGAYWRDRFLDEDATAEEECFAELTRYLLTKYGATGKTFVIQNWEGDWAVRGSFDPATPPSPRATESMIRWLNARQRGVEKGRAGFPAARAKVFHAAEVNLVRQAMEQGRPSVTADVLPHVNVDLVSYSAWDTKDDPAKFDKALAYIKSHKRKTPAFGDRGVYVGEFGLEEAGRTPKQVFDRTAELLEVARRNDCPYAVFWQLYCNERIRVPATSNADYKGFWLIRPDGTRSPVCELFRR